MLDGSPESTGVGCADRLSLVHDRGAAQQQRGVNDVGMADHPADIERGPKHLVRLNPTDVSQRPVKRYCMAAIVANDTFRDTGRARGVKDVERVGRQDRHAVSRPGSGRELMPIPVAARHHVGTAHWPLQNDAMLGLGPRLGDRGIEQRLVGDDPVDLDAARGRQDDPRLGVVDPGASSCAAKPPKTTEWMAPMRAQASMANAASGTIGM